MRNPEELTHIIDYYRSPKNIVKLIILFIAMLLIILFVDMSINPYPPKVSFIDGDNFVKGEIYLDDDYIGKMEDAEFGDLPDDYCKSPHKLSIDTETESFSWQTDFSHCERNLVKFYVKR